MLSAAAILSQIVSPNHVSSQYHVCSDTPFCCSSTWMSLNTHVLQVLQKSWQALAAKTCRLYTRTASLFCLMVDPSIGGPYWVHYPQGTGEWAITFYFIFVTMYAMVSSPPPHTFWQSAPRVAKIVCHSHSSCILCLLTTQGVRSVGVHFWHHFSM